MDDEVLAQLEKEAQALPEIRSILNQKFADKTIECFVLLHWKPGGNLLKSAGKIFLSAAVGMDGPWLLAVPNKQQADSGVLILFDTGDVGILSSRGEYCGVPKPWATVTRFDGNDFVPISKIRIKYFQNTFIHGLLNVSFPLGAENTGNAKEFFERMWILTRAKRAEYARGLVIASFFCIPVPYIGILVSLAALNYIRKEPEIGWRKLCAISLLVHIAIILALIAFIATR